VKKVLVLVILASSFSLLAIEKEPLVEYKSRRDRLADKAKDGAIVLFAAPEKELVEYQPEPNFYYLTGFDEPDTILVIDGSHDFFFLKPRDHSQERWTGPKVGPGSETEKALGIGSTMPLGEFPDFLKKLSAAKRIYALKNDFERVRSIVPGAQLTDISGSIADLRQVKASTEIALLEKAIQITLKGHEAAARTIAPGVMEYEVEAALEYEFRRNGAERPGFPSIVGSGPFSTILHYDKSSRRMESGDVVVVDIGAEYSGYSADVARTYPVSGTFSKRQKEIYQIVLDAQKAAIAEIKAGTTIAKVHAAAFNYIRSKGYSEYFIHGTSHHIGLEVHDVGRQSRTLEPNMVITVEPGIYIPEEQLGIRIEDDVLVTPTGSRILSTFPREIAEIETLVRRRLPANARIID
jgi:Xaa-Pro aminopeptidase